MHIGLLYLLCCGLQRKAREMARMVLCALRVGRGRDKRGFLDGQIMRVDFRTVFGLLTADSVRFSTLIRQASKYPRSCVRKSTLVRRTARQGHSRQQPLAHLLCTLRQSILTVAARRRRCGLKLALGNERVDARPNLGNGEPRALCQLARPQFAITLERRHD